MTITHEPEKLIQVPLEAIAESPLNPRRRFDEERMAELVASVREHGVITPLLARPVAGKGRKPAGSFELAAGHRRLRAARAAGLTSVPVFVRAMDDKRFAEVLNLENLQREDLDELDQAEGYRQLRDLAGYDVATIALKLGRSEKYVYDRLKLLELVPAAQELLRRGLIHAGHAILIARLAPKDQERAIDPGDITAAFQYESPDDNGLYDDDPSSSAVRLHKPKSGQDPYAGKKARTVRELQAWVDANVRFDREHVDPVYHPETAATLFAAQQAEEPLQIVPITRLYRVPPSARADERTLSCVSWKRADGQEEWDGWRRVASKRCEHAVKGVVVVGPGRCEIFDVCTAKKVCKVHWKADPKATKQRSNDAREANARHAESTKRLRGRLEQQSQAFERAWPRMEAAVRARVEKLELDPTSKPLLSAFRGLGGFLDVSDADCDSILKRCRDGHRAILELFALGTLRMAHDEYSGVHETGLRRVDALLGGSQIGDLYKTALKEARKKADKPEKEAKPAASKPKGRAKRAGRTRSALPLVLLFAGALVLLALGGCKGPGWARVASSIEVGAGTTDHRADDALGNPIYADSTQLWVTVRPLAFLEPPTQVVVKGRSE